MRLRAIHLTNFRQHADTRIEFGLGITGIIGPNGTGKTTILEAIAWALYGNEAARGKRDSIRFARADAKAPVRVELDFELAEHRYRVVRGLTGAELYLDGGEHPIANSLTSVSEVLQRRIGMTRAEFFNTYFTGQRELGVMTSLGPTDRGQFLSRVLGYERLRDAQELVRGRRKELVAELAGVQRSTPDRDTVTRALDAATTQAADAATRASSARTARTAAVDRLAEIAPRWESVQRDRVLREKIAGDLRVAELDVTSRQREHNRIAAELASLDAAAVELAAIAQQLAPLVGLRAERAMLDTLGQNDGRRRALADGIKAREGEVAQLVARKTRLADAPRRQQEASAVLAAKRAELATVAVAVQAAQTQLTSDRQEAATQHRSFREQYVEIKTQRDHIVDLGENGTCPTCKRPLGTHFREMLELLDGQLDAVELRGKYFKQRVEQLKAKPAELTQLEQRHAELSGEATELDRTIATEGAAASELAGVVTAIESQDARLATMRADLAGIPAGYDAARHAVVRAELDRLAPVEQESLRVQARLDQRPALQTSQARSAAELAQASARADALRTSLAAHPADAAAYAGVRDAFERADKDARATDSTLIKADAEAQVARAALERARADRDRLAEAEARLAELTRERRMHDELDLAFTDVRAELNVALRPEVSRVASDFLAELTDGRYNELDLDDDYEIVLVKDGTPKPVISGGEEDLANLVLRLAISQMIAERTAQDFSLLVLDEIFGSLDEDNREGVLNLLRALRDRFEQVVLITHIDSVNNGCDHLLTVRFDGETGASVVEQGTGATHDELFAELLS